ncbi:RnfABCDGE type electron transport complex subunit G [Halanaerobacter jeridensis]|uniref:Ion-translocating oxidoreductase complex subunit G n=1 Tax=Halanaerobacter jeridensis TaxID=706427 RepID=A0A938XV66_9FIRM|nr:RnfABCDGE type electron transport complex subunit G [Halanaerobacter jeridensis]MBM7556172.1 electron transport complex protein RnfG [Halanaerobacter jeridensis]
MADKIKPKLIIVLTIIMITSAGVLTFVQQLTLPKIQSHAQQKKENAILTVLPGAEEYEQVDKGNLTLYKGLDSSGNVVGYALQNSGQGFQSVLKIMVGLDVDAKKVMKVKILNQAETPGLGARIIEKQFKSQFNDKAFSDSFQAKKDIDAISGATISSQAMSDVIKGAIKKIQESDINL